MSLRVKRSNPPRLGSSPNYNADNKVTAPQKRQSVHNYSKNCGQHLSKKKKDDAYWMGVALEQARIAARRGEVPVGAVSVLDNRLIAKDHNRNITLNDPSAHAEILVLRKSAKKLKNHRLNGLVVYSTIEPCVMCAGAMVYARIKKSVFGASDPKAGAFGSVYRFNAKKKLNHKIYVRKGILKRECVRVIQNFFTARR